MESGVSGWAVVVRHRDAALRMICARRQVIGFLQAGAPRVCHDRDMTVTGLSPYLYYGDPAAALDWLSRHLGFGPDKRWTTPDGEIMEAEIELGGGTRVAIGGRAPIEGEGAGLLLIVHVDDVDAHYEYIRTSGVAIDPPRDEPYGPRAIDVTDPWGYRWHFWQGEPFPPAG